MILKFTREEREEYGKWASIFMSSQLEILNEITERKAFRKDDVREVILRFLGIDIEDDKTIKKLEELIGIVEVHFDLDKIGALFLLMSMNDKIREEIFLHLSNIKLIDYLPF